MANLTSLIQTRDINGYIANAPYALLPFSTTNQYFTLAQNVVTTITAPKPTINSMINTNQCIAIFSYKGCLPYILPASTPVLTAPTAIFTATLAELAPFARLVNFGQTLQFLTEENNTVMAVGISYYGILVNS